MDNSDSQQTENILNLGPSIFCVTSLQSSQLTGIIEATLKRKHNTEFWNLHKFSFKNIF